MTRTDSTTTHQRVGFCIVALAFATAMAFTTVPTPLWSLYARRVHFSSLTVTVAFAVYPVAVAASLFLAGHVSDWYGRRRVGLGLLTIAVWLPTRASACSSPAISSSAPAPA